MGKPRVLVVDDEPTIRDLVSMVLEEEGYEVTRAEHGQQALSVIESDPPDLVVSDVWMPCLDGLSLAHRLVKRGIPVVLMSAMRNRVDLPGVPVIEKPFDLDRLLQAAISAMAR